MPTGYTDDIKNGISFRKFALSCARAFGALVHMRDDPFDATIPEKFEPNPYYLNAIDETLNRIIELKAMTADQIADAAKEEYETETAHNEKSIRECLELRVKYEDMLAHARGWVPPSSDHVGMKEFMIDQINQSIKFDCDTSYYVKHKPVRKSPDEWIASALEEAHQRLECDRKSWNEEVTRIDSRNEWIRALRESLK